jgi:hypothetical protein
MKRIIKVPLLIDPRQVGESRIAMLGFFYAIDLVFNSIGGRPVEGWASLMVAVLLLGGFQMLMMGILGEYLWRSLDESRRRPRYLIEATVGRSHQKDRLVTAAVSSRLAE